MLTIILSAYVGSVIGIILCQVLEKNRLSFEASFWICIYPITLIVNAIRQYKNKRR